MAEYCGTPQSKEGRNREYEACLSERAILRLLDRYFQNIHIILRVLCHSSSASVCGSFARQFTKAGATDWESIDP